VRKALTTVLVIECLQLSPHFIIVHCTLNGSLGARVKVGVLVSVSQHRWVGTTALQQHQQQKKEEEQK
jgi:hypothetical protein